MHLILRQTGADGDEPEEIEITGNLFAVGRYEQPFSEFERSRVARLSKRHARIFEQDQGVFVADLNSTNGTFVNGDRLRAEPRALRDRDEVSFGGLSYRVLMLEAPSEPTADAPVRLALTPEQNRSLLEPIVISRFPFLINKHSHAFARYKEALPDQLSFISRRHAHFFLKDDGIYIEDLGSTNGTFVSGQQLEEHALRLEDGDTVAFGGDQFVYRVHILEAASDGTTVLPEALGAAENADRTIFIDSPTSFVDIYVGSQESEAEASEEVVPEEEVRKKPRSRVGRGLHLAGELRRSFFGEAPFRPGLGWVAAALVVIVLAAGSWFYWSGRDVRQIGSDMARGEFLAAAVAANAHLATHPGDAEVRAMATEALIRHVVPEWIAHINLQAFDDADEVLARARAVSPDNPDDDGMLDVLSWRTRVSRFLFARSTTGDLNHVLREGATSDELVGWWESDSRGHARELLALSDLVPEFRQVREQIYSDIRHLHALGREQRPVRQFRENIENALQAQDMDAVRQTINEFREQTDLDPSGLLVRDADRMAEVFALTAGQRWLDAYAELTRTDFLTVPFIDHARAMIGGELPDGETVARYDEVKSAWRAGDTEGALAKLKPLDDGPWSAEARALATRYRGLLADRDALLTQRGKPGYDERLFDFYSRLDPEQDGFLVDELRPELASASGRLGERLDEQQAAANAAWHRYQTLGGVQVEARVADRITSEFRELTGLLDQASRAVTLAGQMYGWLDRQPAPEWRALHATVCREIAQQRGLVVGLTVLSTDIRQQKLDLLPEKCVDDQ